MQGTRVQSLAQEDSMCSGQLNSCAAAAEAHSLSGPCSAAREATAPLRNYPSETREGTLVEAKTQHR